MTHSEEPGCSKVSVYTCRPHLPASGPFRVACNELHPTDPDHCFCQVLSFLTNGGAILAKNIRRDEPLRMLDSFLVAGLIEARSHERMQLLSTVLSVV